MGIESFDWSLEVELSEIQAIEPTEEPLETPRETQSAGAEENSALNYSFDGSSKMSSKASKENVCQHTFQPRPESSAGARLLRPDKTLTYGQNILAPRINLKKRLDLNTWREELARGDDDHIVNLQPNALANMAASRTRMVTPIVTKKKMSPKPQKIPMSAGQDTLDTWTVRNNLRRRFDLNSWRQPQEKKEEGDVRHTA